jgi:hypothetical protein
MTVVLAGFRRIGLCAASSNGLDRGRLALAHHGPEVFGTTSSWRRAEKRPTRSIPGGPPRWLAAILDGLYGDHHVDFTSTHMTQVCADLRCS